MSFISDGSNLKQKYSNSLPKNKENDPSLANKVTKKFTKAKVNYLILNQYLTSSNL